MTGPHPPPGPADADYRRLSLWHEGLPDPLVRRPPLEGDTSVDVAVVGAGYTGLWTAYHLLTRDPSLRVLVCEARRVGFGASGRNGGWCIGELAAPPSRVARHHGVDAARRLARALFATVDEVGRTLTAEGIDARFRKGGTVRLARNRAQLARQHEEVATWAELGLGDALVPLGADEARARVRATRVLGGVWFPHTAACDPARLVTGLAAAAERRGVRIVEDTPALAVTTGTGGPRVRTPAGTVRAEVVVRATEGYTRSLAHQRRRLVPLYSLMVATEPLPDPVLDEIGLADRETFADERHLVIYGQRTADGRIAFGGRGAPYGYGSRISDAVETGHRTHELVVATLRDLFPVLATARITHRWGGVLGVPRDWHPSVGFDRRRGLAWAGGYVGEGVAASNLAGRTLADLVTGTDSELVDLAWVGHRSRSWEPEPLRWVAINAALALMAGADRVEERSGRPSRRAALLDRLLGRR
ncbi:MAG: FAD-dependent oxidoreductase [Actinomyces sp.]|nr:MAG: FAD-dependent oxidoreductase [Actinomyces sp.]